MNRWNRQDSLVSQPKLFDSEIAIVGTDNIAQHLLLAACGLGIGKVHLIGEESCTGDGFLTRLCKRRDNVLSSLEGKLNEFGPVKVETYVDFDAFGGRMSTLKYLKAVVDTTNNPISKSRCLSQVFDVHQMNIPAISVSCNDMAGAFYVAHSNDVNDEYFMEKFDGKHQGNVAGIFGGFVTEELRKQCDSHEKDLKIDYYELPLLPLNQKYSKFLLVGAGGGGVYIALALAEILSSGKITIIDPDVAELTNLNRQVIYGNGIGKHKSRLLAEAMRKISTVDVDYKIATMGVEPMKDEKKEGTKRLTDSEVKKLLSEHEVIIGAVDNGATRCFLSDLALTYNKPYVDGAVGHYEKNRRWIGHTGSYVQGINRTLKDRFGFDPSHGRVAGRGECESVSSLIIPHMIMGTFQALLSVAPSEIEVYYDNQIPPIIYLDRGDKK